MRPPRGTIVERLAKAKPSHGNFRLHQDAIAELTRMNESTMRRERDEALAERTSLLDRIAAQKRTIAELQDALNHSRAA